MRFVCPEVKNTSFNQLITQLLKSTETQADYLIDEEGEQLIPLFTLTPNREKPVYFYGRNTIKEYFYQRPLDFTARTVSGFATAENLTITHNLGTLTETFYWLPERIGNEDFESDYWFTVLADDGLHFIKPERSSGVSQIDDFQVLGLTLKDVVFDNVVYKGESGGEFTIGHTSKTVIPTVVNSTLKTMALNKVKSRNAVCVIESSQLAGPGDWFIYEGIIYIVLSKMEIRTGIYQYIAVKEFAESYGFSAGDIIPELPVMTGGNVPLSGDWNAGDYDITAMGFGTGESPTQGIEANCNSDVTAQYGYSNYGIGLSVKNGSGGSRRNSALGLLNAYNNELILLSSGAGEFRVTAGSTPDVTNATATLAVWLRIAHADGKTYLPAVYGDTTASGANVYIDSAGQLFRSTSTREQKTDIEPVADEYSEQIYDLEPVWYRSLCEQDNPDWSWWGLIAEDVAEIDPRLVQWGYLDEDYDEVMEYDEAEKNNLLTRRLKPEAKLRPLGVYYDRLVVLILKELQKMKEKK